jgi:hypothetical protein
MKRLTLHNFLSILCFDCIYYKTDLKDSILYYTVHIPEPFKVYMHTRCAV